MTAATARERLHDALAAAGSKLTNGGTAATCPAHEDHAPSLSIGPRRDGDGVLVNCHAGCPTDDVLAALGLAPADLFDAPREPGTRPDGRPRAVATYAYTDEHGTVLFEKVRLEPKTFRQRRPNGTGWTWSLGDVRRVPYHLPDVLAAIQAGERVYVAEGEKDADALTRAGVTATTWTEGAWKADQRPKWRPDYTDTLTGAHVVIVRDCDDTGRHTAATIAATLAPVAASVAIVEPAQGKDAADHLAAGLTVDQLRPVAADEDEPPHEDAPPEDDPGADDPPELDELLDIVTASDVDVRRVAYLWDRRIPLGACTLLPGEEGIGKTTVGVRIIADMTRGTLPGEFWGAPRDALIIAPEDGLADVMVPRLREAGADLDRVHFVRARIGLDGDKGEVIVPRDLARVGLAVRQWDVAMVWIDSLATTLPDELKSISYKDTAKVLRALGQWAEGERVAVAAPWHLNKATGSDTALRIMDSRAFRTAVRSMLLVVADPDAPEGVTRGIVALDKANAGTLHVPGLRYELRAAPYVVHETDPDTGEVTDRDASCAVAEWIGEVDGDGRQIAREALAPRIEREGGPREWLRTYLAGEGEATRADVLAAARDDGFSEDQIKRAARSISVHSRDETGRDEQTGRPWRRAIWSLPSRAPSGALTPTTAPTAPTGEGYQRPTTPIYAGQPQSVQSVQSGPCVESAPTGSRSAPTGKPRLFTPPTGEGRCTTCGTPLQDDGACLRCRFEGAAS